MSHDGSLVLFPEMFDDFQSALEQVVDDTVRSISCRTHRSAVHPHCRTIRHSRHNAVWVLRISKTAASKYSPSRPNCLLQFSAMQRGARWSGTFRTGPSGSVHWCTKPFLLPAGADGSGLKAAYSVSLGRQKRIRFISNSPDEFDSRTDARLTLSTSPEFANLPESP